MPTSYIKFTLLLGDTGVRIESIEMHEIGHPKVVLWENFLFFIRMG